MPYGPSLRIQRRGNIWFQHTSPKHALITPVCPSNRRSTHAAAVKPCSALRIRAQRRPQAATSARARIAGYRRSTSWLIHQHRAAQHGAQAPAKARRQRLPRASWRPTKQPHRAVRCGRRGAIAPRRSGGNDAVCESIPLTHTPRQRRLSEPIPARPGHTSVAKLLSIAT